MERGYGDVANDILDAVGRRCLLGEVKIRLFVSNGSKISPS